jgi:hypothetical protein
MDGVCYRSFVIHNATGEEADDSLVMIMAAETRKAQDEKWEFSAVDELGEVPESFVDRYFTRKYKLSALNFVTVVASFITQPARNRADDSRVMIMAAETSTAQDEKWEFSAVDELGEVPESFVDRYFTRKYKMSA